jgi:RNA polymerase sigma-70 factor, ECF subfamily
MITPDFKATNGGQASATLTGLTDWSDITRRIAEGDEAAFGTFYNHFFDRLFRYVLVMTRGNEDASREVLQRTMLKVVRYLKPFPSEPMVWSWLTQAAKTAFIDLLRSQKRGPEFVSLEVVEHVSHSQEPAEDEDTVLEAALEKAVQRLPADEQALIQSVYFAERSHKEIAASLQSTPKAIESRLGRVRQKLRNLLTGILNDELKP